VAGIVAILNPIARRLARGAKEQVLNEERVIVNAHGILRPGARAARCAPQVPFYPRRTNMSSVVSTSTPSRSERTGKARPTAVSGDFYDIASSLDAADQELVAAVRTFARERVEPIINDYWNRATFPYDLIPSIAKLGVGGLSYQGYGCAGRSNVVAGFVAIELATADPSMATFQGVHSGLAMGTIYLCGSEEQKRRWLPAMARYEKIGSFGLTEPEVGSGTARGLLTTARRDGDSWVLDGKKMWIGNATFADLNIIWARDVADDQ